MSFLAATAIDPAAACAALISASIRGGIALAVVWIVCRTWRRMPARARCWLWRLAYVKVLAALIWTTPVRLAVLPAKADASAAAVIPGGGGEVPVTIRAAPPGRPVEVSMSEPLRMPAGDVAPDSRLNRPTLADVVLAIWCVGAAIGALRLMGHVRAAGRLRRRCVPVDEAILCGRLAELARRFELRHPPRLLSGAEVPGPLLVGIVRPAIVLPDQLLGGERGTIDLVLAHELAHLRRGDLCWRWLGAAVGVLFFFHPLVWLARREERTAEEMACDELAIAVSEARAVDYARALLAVAARQRFASAPVLAAAGVVDSRKVLEQRIIAMTHLSNWSRRRWTVTAAAALLLALMVIPPWRVVAQEKGAANPAAADKPNPTTDASAAEYLSTLLERMDIEDLAQKDKQLMQLLSERSAVQRELNDLVKVHGYGETHPKVLEMKKALEAADLEVINRARKVKEALGRREQAKAGEGEFQGMQRGHEIIGSIAAATLRIRPAGDGLVDQVHLHEGDHVKKGDVLIQLDSRRAQAALARTEAKVALAESQFARVRDLAKQAAVSREEVDQKEAELKVAQADLNVAKQDLWEMRIISPIDGTVADLSVRAGERVTREQTLATVVESGALKFHASISSSQLAVYAVGQDVTIRAAYPERVFAAKVSRIGPTVDPTTATVRIEAALTGDTTGLLPGMFAKAALAPVPREGAKEQ